MTLPSKMLAVVPASVAVGCRVCGESPKAKGLFFDIEMGRNIIQVTTLCSTCASVLADLIMRAIE